MTVPDTALLLAMLAMLGALLCGCCPGSTTYERSRYEGDGFGGVITDRGRAYVLIRPVRSGEDTNILRSKVTYGPPYTLEVGFGAAEAWATPAQLKSASLVHEGRTIVVHDAASPPLEQLLEYDGVVGEHVARFDLPLGDELPFEEGSTVQVTVVVAVPWEEGELVLEHTFTGVLGKETSTLLDPVMGI